MAVKKRLNYTQMTLKRCREQGRICDKVEHWNSYAGPHGRRIDPFGFIDILCIAPNAIVAIQSTGPHGHSTHRWAILQNEFAYEWLRSGGEIELWSWRKLLKKVGGKLKIWTPRIESIALSDFDLTKGD